MVKLAETFDDISFKKNISILFTEYALLIVLRIKTMTEWQLIHTISIA